MLTKRLGRKFVPGTPGTPGVEGGTYCYTPPDGSWQEVCTLVPIDLQANTGQQIPPGATLVYHRDAQGNVIGMSYLICASQWVPSPSPPEPVCTYVEPVEPVPAAPARWDSFPIIGWDAGGNSVVVHEGACQLKWNMKRVVGAYVGLTNDRAAVPEYERLSHAIMFHQRAGVPHFRIAEYGQNRSNDFPYAVDDEFAVRRGFDGRVSYWHNGTKLQESALPSEGELSAGCTLYATGDAVPAGG